MVWHWPTIVTLHGNRFQSRFLERNCLSAAVKPRTDSGTDTGHSRCHSPGDKCSMAIWSTPTERDDPRSARSCCSMIPTLAASHCHFLFRAVESLVADIPYPHSRYPSYAFSIPPVRTDEIMSYCLAHHQAFCFSVLELCEAPLPSTLIVSERLGRALRLRRSLFACFWSGVWNAALNESGPSLVLPAMTC